jgi:hypothetical protein
MEPVKKHELLAQEYGLLQKTVEEFDARAIQIKAWSVTLGGVGLGAAYTQGQPIVLLIVAFSALVFWIVEALWKVNQQAYYPRIKEIETYFATAGTAEAPPITPFKIATAWSFHHKKHGRSARALKMMWWPHIALPHAMVLLTALILVVLIYAPADALSGESLLKALMFAPPVAS